LRLILTTYYQILKINEKILTQHKMQFSTLLPSILSLSATSLARPQTVVQPNNPVTVSVTNYRSGCSPGGCTYLFNLTTPAAPAFGPGYTTTCSGTDVQGRYVPCSVEDIAANVVPEDVGLVLYIQNTPTVGGEKVLWVGNVTVARPGESAGRGDYEVNMHAFGAISG
jgi:hypothetical protein